MKKVVSKLEIFMNPNQIYPKMLQCFYKINNNAVDDQLILESVNKIYFLVENYYNNLLQSGLEYIYTINPGRRIQLYQTIADKLTDLHIQQKVYGRVHPLNLISRNSKFSTLSLLELTEITKFGDDIELDKFFLTYP